MSITIPTREPLTLVAGDTAAWTRDLPDYSAADGWTLKYRLINAAGTIDITATATATLHTVSVPPATTAAWAAGTYTWTAYVEATGARTTLATGTLVIKPDLAAAAAGVETRSPARQALAAMDAALIAHAANAWTQEYSIAGRTMKFTSAADFHIMRQRLQAEVAREDAAERLAAGLPSKGRVNVRFG